VQSDAITGFLHGLLYPPDLQERGYAYGYRGEENLTSNQIQFLDVLTRQEADTACTDIQDLAAKRSSGSLRDARCGKFPPPEPSGPGMPRIVASLVRQLWPMTGED